MLSAFFDASSNVDDNAVDALPDPPVDVYEDVSTDAPGDKVCATVRDGLDDIARTRLGVRDAMVHKTRGREGGSARKSMQLPH